MDSKAAWHLVLSELGGPKVDPNILSEVEMMAVGDGLGIHLFGVSKLPDRDEIERRRQIQREQWAAYRAEQERLRPLRSALRSRELRKKQKRKR
jgi:hypothetical protein